MSFKALDPSDIVVSSDSVTAPAWSNNVPTLSQFFTVTSPLTVSSYYLDVYNANPTSINAAVQFSIAYGQADGSGSAPLNAAVIKNTPTRINYGQYRNLVYGDAESYFNFGYSGTAVKNIVAISIDRNRYKESLFTGTFNLKLTNGADTLYLTDNSNDATTINYLDCGRVFNIVSGSNGSSANLAASISPSVDKGYTASGSYGFFLPDIGTIILNADALSLFPWDGGLGASWYAGSNPLQNLANSTTVYNYLVAGSSFTLNSQETISSDYIFVRVKNSEFNYTNNPSLITGSGEFVYSNFIQQPQSYITTVGLYNTNNDLLAVAKLSKPLVKDFTKEALIRVKLDF